MHAWIAAKGSEPRDTSHQRSVAGDPVVTLKLVLCVFMRIAMHVTRGLLDDLEKSDYKSHHW